jgi:hypothetical protein
MGLKEKRKKLFQEKLFLKVKITRKFEAWNRGTGGGGGVFPPKNKKCRYRSCSGSPGRFFQGASSQWLETRR